MTGIPALVLLALLAVAFGALVAALVHPAAAAVVGVVAGFYIGAAYVCIRARITL